MAQSPRGGHQVQKEEGRPSEGGPQNSTAAATWGGRGEAVQRQTERVVEIGRERMQQATEASAAAASGALRAGSAVASDAQEITAAWARYAEEVMRHTSEASQALLRARTFAEMLEVRAKLLRDNMQSFVDQSARIAEAAGRMATRPFNAVTEGGGDQTRS
jgi:Phasin protein